MLILSGFITMPGKMFILNFLQFIILQSNTYTSFVWTQSQRLTQIIAKKKNTVFKLWFYRSLSRVICMCILAPESKLLR